ncbi:MAG: hypothetical protein LBL91_00395 [Lachnospiraceae bacterium]|jgi:hypothetical protein|nr:hypothetical protein [Lachnospiraceae bacterium]
MAEKIEIRFQVRNVTIVRGETWVSRDSDKPAMEITFFTDTTTMSGIPEGFGFSSSSDTSIVTYENFLKIMECFSTGLIGKKVDLLEYSIRKDGKWTEWDYTAVGLGNKYISFYEDDSNIRNYAKTCSFIRKKEFPKSHNKKRNISSTSS